MTEVAQEQPGLKRAIGPKLLLFFVVGDILGTGIYALTGKVAGEVGGAVWVPFLIAFAVAFLTAFSYLELVGKYPKAAGAALYANRAFRSPFFTFMIAFAVMCSGITSASSAATAFGGKYLASFITAPTVVVAILFVLLVALINFRGVGESVKANVVLTCIEVSGLAIVIVVGIVAAAEGTGNPERLTQFDPSQGTFFSITAATALAFFAMVGFEDSVNMAEECHEPARTFPRALLRGLAIVGVVYLLVALVSSYLVPTGRLESSSAPLLDVVRAGIPAFPPWLFSVIALFAVANSALINMLMASRLLYGMSNERILPPLFGTVHPARRTPWVAIVFTSLIAVVLVASTDIESLGSTTSLLLLLVFTVVNIAVLVLRRERVEHKHFRAPTVIPVLGAISCAFLASPLSGRDPEDYLIGGVLLAIGVLLWFVNRWFLNRVGNR